MEIENGAVILENILEIYLMMNINSILSLHAQVFTREMKAYIHIHLVFIEALLVIERLWKWPQYPSTGELNNLWCSQIM